MKYCIVNDIDKPHARLVAQVIDGKAYYMQRAVEPYMTQYDGMEIDRATDIEAFGFLVEESTDTVRFTKIGDSIAKYQGGMPRFWQGEKVFEHQPVKLEN